MSSTPYLAVVKAEYEYTATNEEELSIAEEQLLYVLEDDDQDWWKVRVKQSPSSGGASPADAPTGLVPAGYLVPVPPIKQVVAQYEYTATSEEEITIAEGETYDLYEDDGEWSLVGARGGKKEVGFAPTAYLEEDGHGAAASTAYEEASEPAATPMAAQATSSSIGRANGQGDKVKTWSGITELDGKKKKKGTLGVGNGAIFFASDSDKAPVQKKSLGDLNDLKTEKQKHIILTFSDEELHFTVSSKDEHAEIVAKIEASRDFAKSGGGDADEEPAAPAASNSNGGFVPPPPPPPPPPPAVGGGFGHLPPPPRRMFNPSDDEDSDDNDDEPAPARAAPPAAAFVPPPPPPPPAPPAVMSPPVRAPAAAAAAPAPRAPARQDGKKAVAEYEFTAAGTEELSISEGETLWVLDDSADDWWKVRNERGEEGEVPASYITIEDGAAGAGAGQADTGDDEAAARKLQEEQKAEARREKERLRLKALEEEARGLSSFSNVNLPPPPRRTAAASPGAGSGTGTPTRVTSPPAASAPSAVIPPPPPPPPPSSGGEQPRREDSGRDREADREERRRRHREERDRQRREEELLRNRGSTSMPGGGHSAPVEKSKPNASRVRTWKDKTGAFKVDAEFIGLSGANGEKIRLHKLNGVVIEVPVDKMSADDIRVIEHVTRRRLNKDRQGSGDDRRSSQAGGDRERERDRRDERRDRDRDDRRGGGDDSGHRARPPSATAAGKRVSMAASQTKKSTMDWFDFFLNAGCDVDDCSRYANNFEKDRIDESILPDLEAGTLRSLGLREGDIIRVSKHIKSKMGSSAAQGGAVPSSNSGGGSERSTAQRAPSPPEKLSKEEQLMEDEELARKMQEELNAGRDGSGLFTNASGGIKNTRRGRPNANRAAPSSASMDAITSSLTGDRTKTPDIDRRVSPDTSRESRGRASSTAQASSGFDDDAWTVKPATPAPAPAKPSTPSLVDLSPAPSSAPTPPPAAVAPAVNRDLASPGPAMPANSREPSNAQALTDAYLESMGLGKRQVSSPAPMVNRQTASPAPQQQQQQQQVAPQQTGYYAPSPVNNGPRAPVAPIPLNQQLLNPLIPTQTGLTGYVPTRNQPSPMMMPQATGWQPQQQQQPQMQLQQPQPQMLAPMQTGFQGGMGMMQPQQTGYPINQMQQMSIQPTGSPFNQQAMSASPSMYSQPQQQQQMSQAPMQQQQPQPTSSTSSSSSNAADYQPSSIFAQMKTGQFAKPADAPQAEQKYDSLRPQATGFIGGGGFGQPQFPQQQTGFGGMGMGMGMQQTGFGGMGQQQPQQQMQPLQAQPTGFAPGGYVGMPPQQTGMMYGQPQQQQGYPYRQF